jgi:hypothetical protein
MAVTDGSHDQRAIPPAGRDPDASRVDHHAIAEWLPERYRNVLDRLADLEVAGRHDDADRIRRNAIRSYSKRWNAGTAKRLDHLADEALAILATPVTAPRRHGLSAVFRHRAVRTVAPASTNAAPTPEQPSA